MGFSTVMSGAHVGEQALADKTRGPKARRRMTVTALIVAAGKGERLGGDVPKQFRTIGGKPVLRWAAEALARHPSHRPGADRCRRGSAGAWPRRAGEASPVGDLIEGGSERSDSVLQRPRSESATAPFWSTTLPAPSARPQSSTACSLRCRVPTARFPSSPWPTRSPWAVPTLERSGRPQASVARADAPGVSCRGSALRLRRSRPRGRPTNRPSCSTRGLKVATVEGDPAA